MDRTTILVLVICFILMMGVYQVAYKIYPPRPAPQLTNAPAARVTATNATATTSAPAPLNLEQPLPVQPVANTNIAEETLEFTNTEAHYTFSSHGGGLKLIELLRYPESVSTRREKKANRVATLNTATPAPTLVLLGGDAVQGDGIFTLSRLTNGVRAEKTLTNGLTLSKDFEVSSNYLVLATVRFENRSAEPLNLPPQEWVAGAATPMNAQDDGSAVGVMWYDGAKAQDVLGASYFSSRGFACTPRVPPAEYRGGTNGSVVWVAPHNQFFTLAFMPHDPGSSVIIRPFSLPAPPREEVTYRTVTAPMGYEALVGYPALTVPPHQVVARQVAIYAGPKEYRTLASISSTFNNNVDAVMGFGTSGFGAFFGFFSKALLLGMNWLHKVLSLPYGWAIVAITVIIKIVFWPLTQASTRSAKRMQALQPQIKALQEKYKDDPVKAQRKMMEFWKENKVNPMSGCLPTLIQMPVFIGFFYMIRSAIELRGASFLWVNDLSNPDTLFLIPGINFPFNLLPLIMGATMLWQARLTPPSPGMDPNQARIMRYMPLIFMVFLYNFSAGLTLYWTVQNLLSIVQTKLIRTDAAKSPQAPVLTGPPKKKK